MVPSNLKVLAKFGLCSNCSQKLDECSLARARKMFANARMLIIIIYYLFSANIYMNIFRCALQVTLK